VLFEGRAICTQYIPNTDKQFGIKLELCNSTKYRPINNMTAKTCDALDDSYWHNSSQTETVGHKLSMDNSCPALFDD